MPAWPRLPWLLLVGTLGCGASPQPSFIAFARDFAPYPTWEHVTLEAGTAGHGAGARTVYVKARPARGQAQWPVGSLIVKESSGALLGMAKRAPDFNAKGAAGWEWFGLSRSDGGVQLSWRGLGPPATPAAGGGDGDDYGATDQTCNACHGAAKAADSVLTPALGLEP